jgi:hypothetical protein
MIYADDYEPELHTKVFFEQHIMECQMYCKRVRVRMINTINAILADELEKRIKSNRVSE